MSLFFDAAWFDARLAERGLDRGDLAASAGLERTELHRLFTHERAPTAAELEAFAAVLESSVVEVSLRCGVADPAPSPCEDPTARIQNMEARLDEIDAWLASLETKERKKRA